MTDLLVRLRAISKDCICRHAAGCDWVVRVRQEGARYIKPVRLNETGEAIWHGIAAGAGEDALLRILTEGEEPLEETRKDLCEFLTQLCVALEG